MLLSTDYIRNRTDANQRAVRFDHLPLLEMKRELLIAEERWQQWASEGYENEAAYLWVEVEDLRAAIARRERVGILVAQDDGSYQRWLDFAAMLKTAVILHAFADGYLGISLRKIGSEWCGRCPTGHGSNSGLSFKVNDEKGKFYCFGCGTGGDVYDLVRICRGTDTFREQVEYVASALGLSQEAA